MVRLAKIEQQDYEWSRPIDYDRRLAKGCGKKTLSPPTKNCALESNGINHGRGAQNCRSLPFGCTQGRNDKTEKDYLRSLRPVRLRIL